MTDPISQAREALAQQKAYETVCGYPDSDLTQALAALIEHAEQVERERDTHVEQTRNWMREIDKLTAQRDEWKAKAEAVTVWRHLGAAEAARIAPWWHDQGVGIVQGSHWRSGFEAGAAWAAAKTELRSTVVTDEMVEHARMALVRVDSVYLPRKIIRRALEAALGGES